MNSGLTFINILPLEPFKYSKEHCPNLIVDLLLGCDPKDNSEDAERVLLHAKRSIGRTKYNSPGMSSSSIPKAGMGCPMKKESAWQTNLSGNSNMISAAMCLPLRALVVPSQKIRFIDNDDKFLF